MSFFRNQLETEKIKKSSEAFKALKKLEDDRLLCLFKENFTKPCVYDSDVRDLKKIVVKVKNENSYYAQDVDIFDVVQTLLNDKNLALEEDPTTSSGYRILKDKE